MIRKLLNLIAVNGDQECEVVRQALRFLRAMSYAPHQCEVYTTSQCEVAIPPHIPVILEVVSADHLTYQPSVLPYIVEKPAFML